jgi:hypothetical protein
MRIEPVDNDALEADVWVRSPPTPLNSVLESGADVGAVCDRLTVETSIDFVGRLEHELRSSPRQDITEWRPQYSQLGIRSLPSFAKEPAPEALLLSCCDCW